MQFNDGYATQENSMDKAFQPRPSAIASAAEVSHNIAGGAERGQWDNVEEKAISGNLKDDSPLDI